MRESWNMVRQWAGRVLKAAAVLAVVAGVAYQMRFAPVAVAPHRVARGEIVAEVMGTGTLEARVQATVSSKISGRIADVLVDQGDRVQKGQILVHLDDEDFVQQVAIAEADRETAQAAIELLVSDKTRAAAVSKRSQTHLARVQSLLEKNVGTEEDLDQATESLAVAEAGVSRAEAAINKGKKELIAAEKTLGYQNARLADTKIEAPMDGLIVRRQRDPGDVVAPGSSILSLISTKELWVSAWVDETEMAKLQKGQSVRVVFRSDPKHSKPGSVVRLGREADRETREFIVDVLVLELPENWAVGQRAEVYIETARKAAAVLLPARYVVRREGRPGVFVDQHRHAEWRPLTLGLRSLDMVEVVSGLQPGEVAVLPADPTNSLREGRRIVTQ